MVNVTTSSYGSTAGLGGGSRLYPGHAWPSNHWKLKQDICEIGRRIWQREYVAANDGNISVRIGDDRWLCTPTGVSKGYLTPEHVCIVDGKGDQIAGSHRRTSEIRMHLAISAKIPPSECGAVIHKHAPYATAFAIAGITPPNCIAPEVEVFTGPVAMADYETPGTWDFANKVAEHAQPGINTILLKNHGVVTWGPTVEKAYFQTEIIDGYCRVLMLAAQIGGAKMLPQEKVQELIDLKPNFGMPPDVRMIPGSGYGVGCETDGNNVLGRGTVCNGPGGATNAGGSSGAASTAVDEALVQQITDAVFAALSK